jgi:tRNA-2-methylthio-N6-dimethylallyladenosine synthase
MSKKVFIKTFGCQMNEYDSDKMVDVLHAAQGYTATQNVDEADLILFNTCSVREKAQEKVFSDLGRVRHLAQRGVRIGVAGCVASQEGAAIVARAPFVDVVFGPQTLHRLPDLLARRERLGQAQVDISFPEIEKFDHLPPAKVTGASAFVSVMEGCSKYCSYCVVPYTRGEEVSRPFDDVLEEIAGLADQGVREVTLLGQNVNAYRGAMGQSAEVADFATLIEYVAEIPGIERIRYTTSHPNEFTPALIAVYDKVPKLVSHLHLPVQHGSDRILMAMKRGYTAMEYKSTVRKLRAIRPDMALSSDFIVGFPGETDEDFKLQRLQHLQGVVDANMRRISESRLATVQRILVEGPSTRDPSELMGRTECNRAVNFRGPTDLTGQMIDVRITETRSYSLRGELLG